MNIKQISVLLARIALFVLYFWFGVLKIIGQSPANPLVKGLLSHTMPFLPFSSFIVLFGLFEMIIGILFLIPGWEKLASGLFTVHILTTALPLFVLTVSTWQGVLIPTLEGQYIIKNLALIACVVTIFASLQPQKKALGQEFSEQI